MCIGCKAAAGFPAKIKRFAAGAAVFGLSALTAAMAADAAAQLKIVDRFAGPGGGWA
jgi:hypothetical protein